MMVLWQARLAYLAVPKTGTHALETALRPFMAMEFSRPPHVRHMNARQFERFLRPYLNRTGGATIETFALMREPFAWLGSWYRYRARDAISGSDKSTADVSFDAFLNAWLADPQPEYANVSSQARFLSLDDGSLGVRHLYRYEEMPTALAFLSKRLGSDIALSRENVSEHAELAVDPGIRRAVAERLAPDYAIYEGLPR